jgi:NAD(P) transhydrogenase subunit alpha
LIPGRPAPQLVSAETVAAMRPGSVIVDMAAANGGNVAATVKDERVVTDNGVTVLGYTDLAGRLAAQTSQLYGTNIVNLLKLLTPEKDGVLTLDMDDVVQRGIAVTRAIPGGAETMWPPPPVQVSAAPAAPAAAAGSGVVDKEPAVEKAPPDPRRKWYAAGLAGVLFALLAAFSPGEFLGHFTVFALAVVAGYYVISNVAHALHTPLMAETNAISGIILVGGILQVGTASNALILVLAAIAVLVASINIFGGFLVTLRMLQMFRKG